MNGYVDIAIDAENFGTFYEHDLFDVFDTFEEGRGNSRLGSRHLTVHEVVQILNTGVIPSDVKELARNLKNAEAISKGDSDHRFAEAYGSLAMAVKLFLVGIETRAESASKEDL